MEKHPSQWFVEHHSNYEYHMYACKRVLFIGDTPFQSVQILETYDYGKMLILDGKVQSAESDEFIYHEALIHPVMMTHPNPRRILIIGGGEGASLREVLRYSSVEQVTVVDIDKDLIELIRTHLEEWHEQSFDDPRVNLIFGDGRKYLENTQNVYDVIIIDITDILENGPSLTLYTKEFYRLASKRLSHNGLLLVQALELSCTDYEGHAAILATLRTIFPTVRSYKVFIPSFWAEWGFLMASNNLDPVKLDKKGLQERISKRLVKTQHNDNELEFYDDETHYALFQIPKNLQNLLSESQMIIEDNKTIKIHSKEFSLK